LYRFHDRFGTEKAYKNIEKELIKKTNLFLLSLVMAAIAPPPLVANMTKGGKGQREREER
jgi:hypothetical protein